MERNIMSARITIGRSSPLHNKLSRDAYAALFAARTAFRFYSNDGGNPNVSAVCALRPLAPAGAGNTLPRRLSVATSFRARMAGFTWAGFAVVVGGVTKERI